MPAATEKKTYYHGLDVLRAGLMIIGVFWHAVSVVSPLSSFVYDSKIHESFTLLAVIYPEHIFRMEAFFLVSGFLALMIRERKGKRSFFHARLQRVLLPLLLGCFGVNLLLQIFGSQWMGYRWENFDIWRWVMHGWFLITLFICACIDMLLPVSLYRRTGWLGVLLIFTIATFGYAAMLYWNAHSWHFYGPVQGNLFNFFLLNTVQFYPFYFLGSLLFAHRQLLGKIQRKHIYIIGLITLFMATVDYLQSLKLIDLFEVLPRLSGLTYRVLHVTASTGIAFLLFFMFYHSRYQSGRVVRYLINSAIVIYLVHHPLVIILGWALDSPRWSTPTYYALLVGITLLLSYAAYEVIRRNRYLRIAFGLKS